MPEIDYLFSIYDISWIFILQEKHQVGLDLVRPNGSARKWNELH